MLSWIIQITVISTVLILLVHHLINFFKSTLTVPKIKDLVNTPLQNYENIYNIIKQNSNISPNEDYTLIDLLPIAKKDEVSMKNELKTFLKKQLHNGTDISALETTSNSNSNSFSLY